MVAAFIISDPLGLYIEIVQSETEATKSSSYTNSPIIAVSPVAYLS
jgi:hypothetical protein